MWERFGKKLWGYKYFLLLVVILATLWVVFQPQFYASVDEHNYIRSAYLLKSGDDLKSNADQSLGGFANSAGDYVSKYNLGSSIILAVLQLGQVSYQGSLLANLLLTLTGMLAVFMLMRNILGGRHNWLILLIGLYPPVVYFSRTAFSEVSSWLLLTISALLAYKYFASIVDIDIPGQKWQRIIPGVALGFSLGAMTLTRYNLALWAIVLLITGGVIIARKLWFQHDFAVGKIFSKLAGSAIPIAIGAAPAFLLFLLINVSLYDCLLCSGYKLSGEESLQLALLPERIWQYLLYLTPVLLILPAFSRNWLKWPYLLTLYPLLFLYSVAGGVLFGDNIATNFIYGVRFFMPLIPLGVLLAIDAVVVIQQRYLNSWNPQKRWQQVLLDCGQAAVVLSIIVIAAVVSFIHWDFTDIRQEQFRSVDSAIEIAFAAKPELQKLYILGGDGDFIFIGEHLQDNFDKIAYVDVTGKSLSELQTLLDSIKAEGNEYEIVNFSEYSPSSMQSQQKLIELRNSLQ
jgi:hypothetical protein